MVEAQILTVVDAYDAMTFERPYQQALSREEALKEIKAEKGKQFSPRAVEAFLEAEKNFLRIIQIYGTNKKAHTSSTSMPGKGYLFRN